MSKVFAIILFLVLPLRSNGQYSDSVHYYAGFASTGTFNETPTSSSYLLNNGLKLGARKSFYFFNINASWVYGAQQAKLTNNDLSAILNLDVNRLFPHAYYWVLADYTASMSLKINSQYQAGGGLAYNIADRKHFRVNISDGLLYERNDINVQDTIRDVYSTVRNSFRAQFKADTGIFLFNGTCFVQHSLQDGDDYIVRADVSGGIRIRKWLSFTMSYAYNRFNRTGRENTLVTYGLTVEKYF